MADVVAARVQGLHDGNPFNETVVAGFDSHVHKYPGDFRMVSAQARLVPMRHLMHNVAGAPSTATHVCADHVADLPAQSQLCTPMCLTAA
jgi:hypothetical protein